MSALGRVPDVLPFTKADLRLPMMVRRGQRNSISGVQSKVLLSIVDGAFAVVESGGDFILKPVPEGSLSRFAADIPANENLTMEIASRLFRIRTAENKCVRFADGELAYLTRRFDRRNGVPVRQEDLCQIAGRSEETHGESYKYDFSYEEMADLIRMACPASRVELPKIFRQIVFDYLFGNGDAHLKNFSVYESDLGDIPVLRRQRGDQAQHGEDARDDQDGLLPFPEGAEQVQEIDLPFFIVVIHICC